MIRRRDGENWVLISQSDHAALSGELARHVGGMAFAKLEETAIRACAMHDAGWPLHDEAPTLNLDGNPLDVFETPRELGLSIWEKSAEIATEENPYAGLLVSLHSLHLSALPMPVPERFENSQMRQRFENNKFQHKQIELQENLRRKLGLQTDIPLTLGLASPGTDPREDQLLFDFRWLQALDQISLAICCTQSPFDRAMVYARPGRRVTELHLARSGNDLLVSPWPFEQRELSCTIAGRVVPNQPWESTELFRQAYNHAPVEQIEVRIRESG
jgi:hypothetical protein